MVPFRFLERISIRSYIFVTVGTVERPFPAKTYFYPTLFPAKDNSIHDVCLVKKEGKGKALFDLRRQN